MHASRRTLYTCIERTTPVPGEESPSVSTAENGGIARSRWLVRFEARLPRVNGIGGNVPIDELETRDIVEYYPAGAGGDDEPTRGYK